MFGMRTLRQQGISRAGNQCAQCHENIEGFILLDGGRLFCSETCRQLYATELFERTYGNETEMSNVLLPPV